MMSLYGAQYNDTHIIRSRSNIWDTVEREYIWGIVEHNINNNKNEEAQKRFGEFAKLNEMSDDGEE